MGREAQDQVSPCACTPSHANLSLVGAGSNATVDGLKIHDGGPPPPTSMVEAMPDAIGTVAAYRPRQDDGPGILDDVAPLPEYWMVRSRMLTPPRKPWHQPTWGKQMRLVPNKSTKTSSPLPSTLPNWRTIVMMRRSRHCAMLTTPLKVDNILSANQESMRTRRGIYSRSGGQPTSPEASKISTLG